MRFNLSRVLIMVLAVIGLIAVGAGAVSADDNVDPSHKDGRINMVDWVNNNAVYCIDHNGNPTSDGWGDGGIRVLDGGGQVIFFASAAEIDAVGVPAVNTLIKSEGGLSLYRQPDGGFSLNGIDQWDKPFTFVFYSCVPIGPVPYTHASRSTAAPPVNICEGPFVVQVICPQEVCCV